MSIRISRNPGAGAFVAAATWKLPKVKTAANCAACHTQSHQGAFNERGIRIPR